MRPFLCALLAVTLVASCSSSSEPSRTAPSRAVRQLAAGGDVSCAVAADSTAWCWGRGFTPTPAHWDSGTRFRSVSVALASGGSYVCGLTISNTVTCQGTVLVDSTGTWSLGATPTPLANDTAVTTLSAGASHLCGVTAAHQAWCWGQYGAGVRGDSIAPGTRATYDAPTLVAGGHAWSTVAAGTDHSCGLTTGGAVFCWGLATQVGVGDTTAYAPFSGTSCGKSAGGSGRCAWAPLAVTGVASSTLLASTGTTTCAVTTADELWCWGYVGPAAGNAGQVPGKQPVPVIPARVAIGSAGGYCIVSSGGDVYCGSFGGVPALLQGGLKFLDVATGSDHACGVGTTGLLFCWGQNGAGQLGVGDSAARNLPTQVVIPIAG